MTTSLTRRLLGGVLAVLLVSGVAGAQTVSTDTPKIAALRVKANAGDAEAQWLLGNAYISGQGVPKDYTQAAAWFRKAAEQGDAAAQSLLGALYHDGQGVPQDDAQGISWIRKATDQGDPVSQMMLAELYANGQGVPKDAVSAYMWFNLAAARAGATQKTAAAARDALAKTMTPTQIESGQTLSREWFAAFQKRGGK